MIARLVMRVTRLPDWVHLAVAAFGTLSLAVLAGVVAYEIVVGNVWTATVLGVLIGPATALVLEDWTAVVQRRSR